MSICRRRYYRYALDDNIARVYVAINRDEVAGFGFDYRASHSAFGITDGTRDRLYRPLTVDHATEPSSATCIKI